MTRKQYSGEFKEKVCEDYLNSDMTYEEISGKYEIGASTLSKWIGLYREHGTQGFEKQPRKTKNTGKMPEILLEIDRTYPLKSSDRKLEEQNQRLKNLVAEKEIEIQILRETIKKKMKQQLTTK